jgi:hypothetical protein
MDMRGKSECGQSSLEYLLLLAAFFSFFGLMLPVIINITQNLVSSSDDLLAKHISEEVQEQVGLFEFLGAGSEKSLEYSPASNISISSIGAEIFIDSARKQFKVTCSSAQNIPKQDFNQRFFIKIQKEVDNIKVFASK